MASYPHYLYYEVCGIVQRVMFRQTIIRAAIKRNLQLGASNCKINRNLVKLTFIIENEDEKDRVRKLAELIGSGIKLNNWGAQTTSISEKNEGIDFSKHQVTTLNVDSFDWNPNVEMYI
eukprot:TRINITY_DN281_c1_g1_i1.p1 TRINITY_DN281_c1_g1~~TRINITY_DN281_c1_g1_i1.p1  ORF type:complete len:119 (+),score=43.99 TRINITY_DN281_c1_g1_i1:39-395(+)